MRNALQDLGALQAAIGVSFRDPTLLRRALTHTSYLNENPACSWGDNERLEFLGDSWWISSPPTTFMLASPAGRRVN